MNYTELTRLLKQNGIEFVSHGKKHDIYFSPKTGRKVTVPRHGTKEIPDGTLNNILKTAGLK
jgi:predicted RNA binding protein YcfA (HicA-like mRNA interferase family)